MNTFAPGQRWFSSAEPELGLGTVLRLAGRQVQIVQLPSGHNQMTEAPEQTLFAIRDFLAR